MRDPKTFATSHVFAKAAEGIDWSTITITAGANTSPGTLAEVSFANVFGKNPKVVITGQDATSAALSIYATPGPSKFIVGTNITPSTANVYKFSYFVIE